MTAALPVPLPQPNKHRWQPLRLGLVDLYFYDCEEFWFKDGHLLLRGNNGTSKSKVMSLTLPFLLDADLSPSRVEPDGDRNKRMEWNLLLNGRYDRRTGYSWIEFGRLNEVGKPEYVTLGCGMLAVVGRSKLDHWRFITNQRMGDNLALVGRDRVVLSRERLSEALEGHGQVFETGESYRRAVDEKLFHLGQERYRALMDTLISLRQPQLSKNPNEAALSAALTEALPPMPQDALEDVAEAMKQLDEYRSQLAARECLHKVVLDFQSRYQKYAAVATRRQAKRLRQAQTEYDNASSALNAAKHEFDDADSKLERAGTELKEAERVLERARAAREVLQRDPAMRQAAQLNGAEQEATEKRTEAGKARESLEADEAQHQEAIRQASGLRGQAAESQTELAGAYDEAAKVAAACGLAAEHEQATRLLRPFDAVTRLSLTHLETMGTHLRGGLKHRREQLATIRKALNAVAEKARLRDIALSGRQLAAAALEGSQTRAVEMKKALDIAIDTYLAGCSAHASQLRMLPTLAPGVFEDLADWADSLRGPNPFAEAIAVAHAEVISRLAHQAAAAKQRGAEISARIEVLEAEGAQLRTGKPAIPPAPYTRAADVRADAIGAPLWQLLEFRPSVTAAHQAALEAALEAAGLLDAWVTTDGALRTSPRGDIVLTPRAPLNESLRDVLVAADDAPIEAADIEAILASIEYAESDRGEAEAWVSHTGDFRVGPARGHWMKPAAQYIGYAARQAATRRRLEEIEAELASHAAELERVRNDESGIAAEREQADHERKCVPADESLRQGHSNFEAAEDTRRRDQESLAEEEAKVVTAERAWTQARDTVAIDAEDLRLPTNEEGLTAVSEWLNQYGDGLSALISSARAHRNVLESLYRQLHLQEQAQARAHDARDTFEARSLAAERAEARRDELRATVGAAVDELNARLAASHSAVTEGEARMKSASDAHGAARERRAVAGEKQKSGQAALDAKHEARQLAIEYLRAFAESGLFTVALPELVVPDPTGKWTIDPALNLARRAEQLLTEMSDSDEHWKRVQEAFSRQFNDFTTAMSQLGYQAQSELIGEFGFRVQAIYENKPERPDVLAARLHDEIQFMRDSLTREERRVLEDFLKDEIAVALQKLVQGADQRVRKINAELDRRPTTTGIKFRLEWDPWREGKDGGAPVGLAEARKRLLNMSAAAWSDDDRERIGEFLRAQIERERARDSGQPLLELLTRAFDYRAWHHFVVKRFQDGSWRKLSGPASGGERALGLTVPLFAAASSHYASTDYAYAPRLVLLDEAFVGIDDNARAHCMGLIREFDLDIVMTSEREWGCYAELPGLSICQLTRQAGVDAVHVSRWTWDGKSRQPVPDPTRRLESAAA
jgi:uncharacterized protein (TIGR02680 family)